MARSEGVSGEARGSRLVLLCCACAGQVRAHAQSMLQRDCPRRTCWTSGGISITAARAVSAARPPGPAAHAPA